MIVIPFENCSVWSHGHIISALHPFDEIERKQGGKKTRTNILPRRIQGIKVVQIRQRGEELARPAALVPDHEPALAGAFDLEDFNDRTIPRLDVPHHALVDLQSVFGGFLEEGGVGDGADVGFATREGGE